MMRLSALWNQLHQRELVTRNPWTGWNFENGQRTVRRSWTARELALLASASWHSTSVPEQTFRLVTLIAAYSGMRLGEICTLRKEDLQTFDGIPCFLIRPHTETGWAPKTEAGTRIVPVHSKLIEAGLLALKDITDGHYLIPGLETSKQGVRGAALGRAFSLLKTRIGACPLKSRSIPSGTPYQPNSETRMPISGRSGLTASLVMKQPTKVRAPQPI